MDSQIEKSKLHDVNLCGLPEKCCYAVGYSWDKIYL